jgi:hypothetical protein
MTHVIAANIPWKIANRRSGTLALPTDGAPRTPLKPKLSRLPIYLPAEWEKANEYPQKNHWNETTPTDMIESHINESADFGELDRSRRIYNQVISQSG